MQIRFDLHLIEDIMDIIDIGEADSGWHGEGLAVLCDWEAG